MNPKSLANLKPPKKGEPARNPKGRPKGNTVDNTITALVKKELLKHPIINGKKSEYTWIELHAQAWLRNSLKNPVLFKELLDRIEGKVSQPITGADNGPIQVEIDAKGKLSEILNRLAERSK